MSGPLERWAAIPGYPDYEASDAGNIRSHLAWRGLPTPRLLSPCPSGARANYLAVHVRAPDRRFLPRFVHQLVLLAFRGERPAESVTRHLNGNPRDNRLANLAYGTNEENMQDRVAHGGYAMSARTHCYQGHPFSGDNLLRDPLQPGTRRCRECRRLRYVRSNAKRRKTGASL